VERGGSSSNGAEGLRGDNRARGWSAAANRTEGTVGCELGAASVETVRAATEANPRL